MFSVKHCLGCPRCVVGLRTGVLCIAADLGIDLSWHIMGKPIFQTVFHELGRFVALLMDDVELRIHW